MKRLQKTLCAEDSHKPDEAFMTETEKQILRFRDTGDRDLRNSIILENLGLVYSAFGRMKISLPSGMDTEDAISFGIAGLIETVDRFDMTKGHFTSLAYPRIQGAIYDGINRYLWSRRSDQRIFAVWSQSREALEKELGRSVSSDEVAERLSLSGSKRIRYLTVAENSIPLSLSMEDGSLRDRMGAEEVDRYLLQEDLRLTLLRAVERLPERERLLVREHYYHGLSLRECARLLGCSNTRAFELHKSALNRLRIHLNRDEI